MLSKLPILVLPFLLLGVSCNDKLPQIKTPLGDVRGYHKTSLGGRKFSAFEGIPFAKPPVGIRRFEEPEYIEPWSGTWNASFLTTCVQTLMLKPNQTTGDEDCLHINVYVPRVNPKADENLDVIVHIHGGAYLYGSGHGYSQANLLMDREVIFITFNYRLGVLGFLSTEDDVVPGNNGLKDQTMALKWVQENIASFGGNPNSVTITGLSAGGSSVHLHYFSNISKGLFHRGFSQSGLALNPFSVQEEPLSRAKKIANSVGCPTTTTRILVDCLKQRPYKHILDKIQEFFSFMFMPCVPFGPVIERGGPKPFLNAEPYYLLKNGQVYDVPWLTSTTIHEGTFPVLIFLDKLDYIDQNWNSMAPYLLEFNYTLPPELWEITSEKIKKQYFGDGKINKENILKLIQVFTDRYFAADAETAVRLQGKINKSPVYYYILGYPGDNNPQKYVGHGFDSKYFYGRLFPTDTLSANELKMKDLLLDMVVSFAKSGAPTFDGIEWKPTKDDQLIYLIVNGIKSEENRLAVVDELTNRKFWKSLNFAEGENLLSNQLK